jgi:hypothetical protein
MNQTPLFLLFALLPGLALAQQAEAPAATEKLTWDDLRKPIRWTVNAPPVGWAWDRVHVEFTEGGKKRWFDPATQEVLEPRPQQRRSPRPARPGARRCATGSSCSAAAAAPPATRSNWCR